MRYPYFDTKCNFPEIQFPILRRMFHFRSTSKD